LHHQLAVFVVHLAYHALDVINAVLFHRAAVKFVVVFARTTHVNVKYVYFGIGVLFANKHCMLSRVHTANLTAIGFAATAYVT